MTARMLAWKQLSFKECVTAHWSSDGASIIIGHQVYYRSLGLVIALLLLVGEHSTEAEALLARQSGLYRKANVGISNDKTGEKPVHQ